MVERETSAAINEAAALWAVRVDGGSLDPSDEAELQAWFAADPRRLGAYARARAMLAQANRIRALGPSFDPDSYVEEHGVVACDRPRKWIGAGGLPTRRGFLVGASAAAAASVAIGLAWPAAATTYSTRRGEIRRVPLADGSSMTLNTETIAKVLFTRSERHVELVEGEAIFDVVSDDERLFVVEAGTSLVKAVATSFTVSRLPHRELTVMVRQGKIQLMGPASHQPSALLTANTRALVSTGTARIATVPMTPSEMNRDLAWQRGMLSFEDTPLVQAAEQFARYSETAIRFEDPDIARETITGLYAANDPRGFARSAALSLGIRSSEQPGAITLSR